MEIQLGFVNSWDRIEKILLLQKVKTERRDKGKDGGREVGREGGRRRREGGSKEGREEEKTGRQFSSRKKRYCKYYNCPKLKKKCNDFSMDSWTNAS